MANIKSQKKRNLTNEKHRQRNRAVKSELKTATRRVREAVEVGNGAEAYSAALAACRLMDKAATKGVIHKKQAANRKSGIMALANTIVTQADIDAYVKAEPKKANTGSKKAARKAERKVEQEKANAEKAKRVEAQKKLEKKAAERKAKEAAEAEIAEEEQEVAEVAEEAAVEDVAQDDAEAAEAADEVAEEAKEVENEAESEEA